MTLVDLPGTRSTRSSSAAARLSAAWWRVKAVWQGQARADPHANGSLLLRLLGLLVVTRLTMATTAMVVLAMTWHRPLSALPWGTVATIAVVVAALSADAVTRLHGGRPIKEGTYLAHLMGDVATVTLALAMTGGVDNPLFGFYLLPLLFATYALTGARLALALAVIVLSMLLQLWLSGDVAGQVSMRELSELVAIALAGIIAYAVAALERRNERALLRLREAALTEQGSRALGAMAIRTADVISSPLATMSVLVHELRSSALSPIESGAALDELTRQIRRCKGHLSDLQASAGLARTHSGARIGIDKLLEAAAQECELMAPLLSVEMAPAHRPAPEVIDERCLFDAFVLLIQHRGLQAPHAVRTRLEWNKRSIIVYLCGAPEPATAAQEIAKPMVALAASLLGPRSGTVTGEFQGDRHCWRIELPRPISDVGLEAPTDQGLWH